MLQKLLREPGIEVEKEGVFMGWKSSDLDSLSGEEGTRPVPSLAQVHQHNSRARVLARDTGQVLCHQDQVNYVFKRTHRRILMAETRLP